MGQSIPYDYRKLIVLRRKSGMTYKEIQEEINYSISGIRKIWYQYQKEGEACFTTDYENCGKKSNYPQEVHDAIETIRTGEQGAYFVYSMLKLNYPHLKRPSVRTIQRWWEAQGINRPTGRPAESEKKIGLSQPTKHGK